MNKAELIRRLYDNKAITFEEAMLLQEKETVYIPMPQVNVPFVVTDPYPQPYPQPYPHNPLEVTFTGDPHTHKV